MYIRQQYEIIKSNNKCICHIETNNGDGDLMYSGDDKSVLNLPNRDKTDLGLQG